MLLSVILSLLALGWLTYNQVRKIYDQRHSAVTAAPPVKAVSAPTVSGHRLVKTYVSTNSDGDPWIRGWRFLCSCGVKGPAAGLEQQINGMGGKLGSESSAIDKFKLHRDRYLEVNGNDQGEHEDTAKLRELKAEFAEYVSKCFCKDTNDDLLLLKHRHLDKEA